MCWEQPRLVAARHRDPAPSAASLPVFPEHHHHPTGMTRQKVSPGLVSECPGSLWQCCLLAPPPVMLILQGWAGPRTREPPSRLCTRCSFPGRLPVPPAGDTGAERNQAGLGERSPQPAASVLGACPRPPLLRVSRPRESWHRHAHVSSTLLLSIESLPRGLAVGLPDQSASFHF